MLKSRNAKIFFCSIAGILFLGYFNLYAQKEKEMKKAVMVIAQENFRDEELFLPKQILEKNNIQVKVASTVTTEVTGMLGGKVTPDMLLSDIEVMDLDALVFIGGIGASQYWNDPVALRLAQNAAKNSRLVAAICLAPVTLANAGLLRDKQATVWSSEASQLKAQGAKYTGRPVEKDGNIITADGPTSANEFAQELVRALNK